MIALRDSGFALFSTEPGRLTRAGRGRSLEGLRGRRGRVVRRTGKDLARPGRNDEARLLASAVCPILGVARTPLEIVASRSAWARSKRYRYLELEPDALLASRPA